MPSSVGLSSVHAVEDMSLAHVHHVPSLRLGICSEQRWCAYIHGPLYGTVYVEASVADAGLEQSSAAYTIPQEFVYVLVRQSELCMEVHLFRMMSLCCFRHHTPFQLKSDPRRSSLCGHHLWPLCSQRQFICLVRRGGCSNMSGRGKRSWKEPKEPVPPGLVSQSLQGVARDPQVLSRWCPWGVPVVSLWCPGGVLVVSLWCPGGVPVVSR